MLLFRKAYFSLFFVSFSHFSELIFKIKGSHTDMYSYIIINWKKKQYIMHNFVTQYKSRPLFCLLFTKALFSLSFKPLCGKEKNNFFNFFVLFLKICVFFADQRPTFRSNSAECTIFKEKFSHQICPICSSLQNCPKGVEKANAADV